MCIHIYSNVLLISKIKQFETISKLEPISNYLSAVGHRGGRREYGIAFLRERGGAVK